MYALLIQWVVVVRKVVIVRQVFVVEVLAQRALQRMLLVQVVLNVVQVTVV